MNVFLTPDIKEKNKTDAIQKSKTTMQCSLGDIQGNILFYAINCNKAFFFASLKKAFPQIKTKKELIDVIKKQEIKVLLPQTIALAANDLPKKTQLEIAKKALQVLSPVIQQEIQKGIPTKTFIRRSAKDKFPQTLKYTGQQKTLISEDKDHKLDLSCCPWFLYEDNLGTSEENAFLCWFANNFMTPLPATQGKTALEAKGFYNIILARNEEKSQMHVKLFSWLPQNYGVGFLPDFVLFMTKNKNCA